MLTPRFMLNSEHVARQTRSKDFLHASRLWNIAQGDGKRAPQTRYRPAASFALTRDSTTATDVHYRLRCLIQKSQANA